MKDVAERDPCMNTTQRAGLGQTDLIDWERKIDR